MLKLAQLRSRGRIWVQAVWPRHLSAGEPLLLYRRGAQSVCVCVCVCICVSDESGWLGWGAAAPGGEGGEQDCV